MSLVIRPVLDQAPINQLLVTGGVLFVLQAGATLAFGIDFKNLGVQMGSLRIGDMSFSWSKILTFVIALWRHADRLAVPDPTPTSAPPSARSPRIGRSCR